LLPCRCPFVVWIPCHLPPQFLVFDNLLVSLWLQLKLFLVWTIIQFV
jgi:hypothetical protein